MKRNKHEMTHVGESESLRLYNLLPHDHASRAILVDRAKQISKPKVEHQAQLNNKPYICFRLGKKEQYGIPYSYALEVMHASEITAIPQLSKVVAGITNWRGKLLMILDINEFFGLKTEATVSKYYSIIVVSCQGITIGILVNNIACDAAYDPVLLQPTLPMKGTIKSDYILGIDQGKTAILNIEAIVTELQNTLKT